MVEHSKDDPLTLSDAAPTKILGKPFDRESYKDVCAKTAHVPVHEKSTFLVLKELLDSEALQMQSEDATRLLVIIGLFRHHVE